MNPPATAIAPVKTGRPSLVAREPLLSSFGKALCVSDGELLRSLCDRGRLRRRSALASTERWDVLFAVLGRGFAPRRVDVLEEFFDLLELARWRVPSGLGREARSVRSTSPSSDTGRSVITPPSCA